MTGIMKMMKAKCWWWRRHDDNDDDIHLDKNDDSNIDRKNYNESNLDSDDDHDDSNVEFGDIRNKNKNCWTFPGCGYILWIAKSFDEVHITLLKVQMQMQSHLTFNSDVFWRNKKDRMQIFSTESYN